MDISLILLTTFIALVGLQLCVPDGEGEKMADKFPHFWCENPWLRMGYGLMQLIGVVFVLGMALFLTFTENWWYILVYLCGVIVAKFVALLIQVPIGLLCGNMIEQHMYGGLRIKRLVGTILIVSSLVMCLISL